MTNLHESKGPDWDRTHNPWICSRHVSAVRHVIDCPTTINMIIVKDRLSCLSLKLFLLLVSSQKYTTVPVNIFSVTSGRVILVLTSTKQWIKCLAEGHNSVTQLLEPATL